MLNKKLNWHKEINIGGIKQVDILLFTKHLSVALESGLTLVEGLELLRDQAKGKMKMVINGIHETVYSGKSFHEALNPHTKYFSAIYINMVKSGELSGTLQENLARLSDQLNKKLKIKKKVKSAMLYPMFIFIAIFGLGMSVAIFVLPKILPLFKILDVELPVTTKALIYVAELFETQGLLIFAGMIVGTIFLIWFFKADFMKPISHRIMLKIPIIKHIIIKVNLERFLYTLGTLLESGISLDQAIKITTSATDNRVYKKIIGSFLQDIEAGKNLASSLVSDPKLFPIIVSRMVGVGERTGNLHSTLKYLSKFYEEEIDSSMKNLSTIIEPVLLIFIGIIVGTVAISILGPIYQITGSLRN
ncbi:type II secretion system F family protein [Patescibacteria group bacterium]